MPIPTPWIRAYDVPGEFTKGFGLGAQQAEANIRLQLQADQLAQQEELERARMDQRQREVALETETKKELATKQMLMEQARADITRAYHESQIGLEKQRLEEAKRINNLKVEDAARQLEAQEGYERDRAGGMSARDAALRHPEMFRSMAGFSALANKNVVTTPTGEALVTTPVLHPLTKQPMPGVYGAPTASGATVPHNVPGYQTPEQRMKWVAQYNLRRIDREITEVDKQLALFPQTGKVDKDMEASQKRFEERKRRLEEERDKLEEEVLGGAGFTGGPPLPAPVPEASADWVDLGGGFRGRVKKAR